MRVNSVVEAGWAVIKNHWLFVIVLLIAILTRTWQLSSHSILFGDAARDLKVAVESIENFTLPLLGIPSSVPRFKQGPVTIWIEMVVYIVAGYNFLALALVFAGLNVLAVIGVYWLANQMWGKWPALVAAIILTASPLAIAHGRMIYHITPLPLALILFLYCLWRLAQNKPHSLFWAGLSWCLVFQFELAVFPLVLMIPLIVWINNRLRNLKRRDLIEFLASFVIGLWPQIVFDVTHGFAQVGGFLAWVGYRLVTAAGVSDKHMLDAEKIWGALNQFWLYGNRIFSYEQAFITALMFSGVVGCLALSGKFLVDSIRRGTLKFIDIICLSTVLLTIGYIIHGSPSEAYFPPFLVLWPLLLGWGVTQLKTLGRVVITVLVIIIAIGNISDINHHNWFVSSAHRFSYGVGSGEQQAIMAFILGKSGTDFKLETTQPGGEFPNYFDNLRWWAQTQGIAENQTSSHIFYVEAKNAASPFADGISYKLEFPSVDVYYQNL